MRRAKVLLVLSILWVAAATAVAQEESPGLVSKIHLVIVEPGDTLEFEAAFREHLQLHKANNDPWSWHTWQIVNGEHFGQFLIRSHGHNWKDFDEHAEARRLDLADFMTHVAPHIEKISSTLEVLEPSISNWSDEDSRPELVEMTRFWLHYGASDDFLEVVQKIHRAVRSKDPSADYAWSTTVNGSEGPTMTLAVPLSGWADYADNDEASVWEILEEVYGVDEGKALRDKLGRSIRSQKSSVIQFRADLSYEAGG
jgi:hypothetical protein